MAGGTRGWEGRVQNCPLLLRIIYRQITKTSPSWPTQAYITLPMSLLLTDARKIRALKVWHTKSQRPPVVRLSVSIAYGKSGAPCEFRLLIKFSEKSVWVIKMCSFLRLLLQKATSGISCHSLTCPWNPACTLYKPLMVLGLNVFIRRTL